MAPQAATPLDPHRPAAATLALALLAVFIVFAHLGEGYLANFDDCYYAQKAKETVAGGDWVTPHYDGQVSLDNPPLVLWLMAGSFLLLGVRNVAAILPSAIAGVLCVVLLHRLALRLGLSAFAAWCAAVVLLTTQYFLKYSRHAMFDVFLTLLFLLAMHAYLRAREGRPAFYALLGVLCGLGVLTKNVLGLFPLVVAALHLAWTGRARDLLRLPFWLAPLAAAATVAPWYLAQLGAHRAQFVEEHFRWLLLERGFAPTSGEPGWINYLGYARDLATYYWPWLPVAVWGIVLAVRRAVKRNPVTGTLSPDMAKLILLWLVIVIGVMSAGREKKLWYIMTAFPALALAASLSLDAWFRGESTRRRAVTGSLALLATLALALNFAPSRRGAERLPGLDTIARAVSTAAAPGARIVNYANGYWSIQNFMLFYSDHGLTKPTSDPDSVRAALDGGALALVATRRTAEIAGPDSAHYRVWVRSGAWALMRAGPDLPVTIPSSDPYR
ncbi:MAG TPA: phospholipid carrier-dependent glycosyltransferase [Candidatus Binatia bacterium]|nr:phospholipid carrier-dependent glycosyltransferase [Candidatus Binatia bacterium]